MQARLLQMEAEKNAVSYPLPTELISSRLRFDKLTPLVDNRRWIVDA